MYVCMYALGLSIRAAVLMGVDRGKLKDLLMMDMLSTTIGIKSFHNTSDANNSNETMLGEREMLSGDGFFEPILQRGERLPARRRKIFKLADPMQELVTIDVFEEVEVEVPGQSSTGLELRPMGSFNFPVPEQSRLEHTGSVSVWFSMDDSGVLSVTVGTIDNDDWDRLKG